MVVQFIKRCLIWRALPLLVTLAVFAFPAPAPAALGGNVATVQADQVHMKGTLQITNSGTYVVQEIKAPAGTAVREYVSPAGKIFAVAWQGPFLPDLRQLLGVYFEQFSQAAQARKKNYIHIRGPLLIQEPGLIVQSGGHMRGYHGRAYIPELVPPGVSIEDLK